MQKVTLFTLTVLSITVLAGCNVANPVVTNDGKIKVAASFYPLAYFTTQIGGDQVTVVNLTPAGVEPHDYELTPQDIATIQASQLLILNGGQFEPWASDVTTNLADTTTVITAGGDVIDPHVWLSPQLAQQQVATIVEAFVTIDPTQATVYQTNSKLLIERLQALDTQYATGLANCEINTIVTAHTAFSHLANAYGLEQLPIAGLSPETEPSLDELADITDFAKQHHVQYIFFESLVSPKLSETIASEIGAQTLVLNPIEGLTDEEIAAGQDYFTVMQENLVNLRTALQCQ